jgi:hypothetical protein
MKKFLVAQGKIRSLPKLQAEIDRFVSYYNDVRPHRGVGRRTPKEVFDQRVKAHPTAGPTDHNAFRVRHDRVDSLGKLTLRYGTKLHHIGMGRRFARTKVTLLIAYRDVRIVNEDGELLRHLTIDPDRDYHPQSLGWISTMS